MKEVMLQQIFKEVQNQANTYSEPVVKQSVLNVKSFITQKKNFMKVISK